MIRRFLMVTCAMAVITSCTEAAVAAAVAKASRSDEVAENIEEVVVTATKRHTKLEQTPVSVTAFNQAAINQNRIDSVSEVAQLTPGLVLTSLSPQDSFPSMRGTTKGSGAAGANLSVSVFIDGVPTTGVGDDNPDLFDLRSIEVLRGPQGTLFGQNVTGGAIVIRTLKPSFTPELKAQATYGSRNLAEFRGYVSGPISNTVAGNLSFHFRRQSGYLHDLYLRDRLLSTLMGGGRGQILWTPNNHLSVLFGADYNIDSSPYKVYQLDGNFQPTLFPKLYFGPSDANQGLPSQGNARTGGGLIRVVYNSPFGTLTSITGLRSVNDKVRYVTSADPENQLLQTSLQQDTQFTEEVRFTSPAGRKWEWVAGLFLLNADRHSQQEYNVHVLPGTVVSFVPPYRALNFNTNNDQHITDRSYAAYGDVDYSFSHELKLTMGARFTYERKSGHSEVTDTSGLSPSLLSGLYAHNWTAFTPKVTLAYTPTQHFMGYITIANGFTSGGYDTSAGSVAGLRTPFQPETVWSYEAGAKTSLFSDKLVINGDIYYADYTNMQVKAYNSKLLQYVTANAGVAKVPGVELEMFTYPFHWLSLHASYSYMGAFYTHYMGTANFSGHQIPFDPTNQYHLGGDVHFISEALSGGTVRIGGDVSFQTRRYFEDANSDASFIHGKSGIDGLVNLHAIWYSRNDTWEVSLWGKNITNDRYIVNSINLSPFYANIAEYTSGVGNSMNIVNWNPPSTIGITVTYNTP